MTDAKKTFCERQSDVAGLFAGMDDELDRYSYLTALGGMLEAPERSFMTDDRLVKGCQSRVWLDVALDNEGSLRLTAYSDTLIVRGLLFILRECVNGTDRAELLSADIFVFDRAGISGLLSPTRRGGLAGIIGEIRRRASAL